MSVVDEVKYSKLLAEKWTTKKDVISGYFKSTQGHRTFHK